MGVVDVGKAPAGRVVGGAIGPREDLFRMPLRALGVTVANDPQLGCDCSLQNSQKNMEKEEGQVVTCTSKKKEGRN